MARDEEKIMSWEKPNLLADAVMIKTPSEVKKYYKSLDKIDFTARTLGLACRYRGLDMVKALVDGGAKFTYDFEKLMRLWRNNKAERFAAGANYATALLKFVGVIEMNDFVSIGKEYGCKILSIEERLEILDYLCETAGKTGFDKDDLLFCAYFSGEYEIIDHLKKKNAVIPKDWITIVTEGGWDDPSKGKWFDYCTLMEYISDKDLIPGISAFVSELGGRKLHYTDWLWYIGLEKRQSIPGFYKFLTESYDLAKVNKGKMMKSIIENDRAEGLAAVAELGWLKQPRKRDEMIAFASEKKKTECTAWLLDFKNRTADFTAERVKAEKKAQRELNADPNSKTELKKLWNWENRDDGTVIITGYKGNKTEITVPERIGGDAVTAIGEFAFSPDAKRIRAEQREIRRAITEINLPDTVTEIGEYAFSKCSSLTHFDIPPGLSEISKGMLYQSGLTEITISGNVKKIEWSAFFRCYALKTVVLCEGVREIGNAAFYHCFMNTFEIPRSVTEIAENWTDIRNATVIVYKGSYAEQFCIENKFPFKYKE